MSTYCKEQEDHVALLDGLVPAFHQVGQPYTLKGRDTPADGVRTVSIYVCVGGGVGWGGGGVFRGIKASEGKSSVDILLRG